MKHGERSGSSHISLLNRGIYFSKIIMYSPPPLFRAQKFRMVFHTMLTCFPVIMSSWGKIWKFEGAWGKNMWKPCLFPMFSSIFPIFPFCFPFFLSLLPSFFSSFFFPSLVFHFFPTAIFSIFNPPPPRGGGDILENIFPCP